MVEIELVALIASRICHDLVGPVGAIANGVEILAEEAESGSGIQDQALDLIAGSATQASRRLAYCRLAFGAGGGAGAMLDTNDVIRIAKEFLEGGRAVLDWPAGPAALPRNAVKIALLFVLAAADCLARGGRLSVAIQPTEGRAWQIRVRAAGDRLTTHPALAAAVLGHLPMADTDAKLAPLVYAGHLARLGGGRAEMAAEVGALHLLAEVR